MSQDQNKDRQSQVIDENLKRVYQDMLDEKVPDRFLNLLSQLKNQQGDGSRGDSK